jgi:hypothetical protein
MLGYTAGMARTPARPKQERTTESGQAPNPVWFRPVMFGFMLLGLLWLVVYYVSNQQLPVKDLHEWNIAIGLGIAFIGFLMTTRWR